MAKHTKVMRVALYERVSTDEQALRGYSIEAQIDDLEKFAKDKGYKVVGHYTDAGISGGKGAKKRPAMSRLLEDVEAGLIDLILFTKLDRWFRNIQEYFKVQEIIERNRVEWKAITEDYDTTTANGRMAITIFLAVAQNEREKGSERINAVLDHKRRNKEACIGGKYDPAGYKRIKDENGINRLVIDPETEPQIREFWRICLENKSVQTAGRIVNLTFGTDRAYKDWLRIYHNEFYRGEYKGVKEFCPAYITNEEWQEIESCKKIKYTKKNRIYLFTGMILCPACGCLMTSNFKYGKTREYYSYRCRHSQVARCKHTKMISEMKTEKWLLNNLKSQLEKWLINAEIEDNKKDKRKPKCSATAITEKIRRLNVIYMSGGKSDDEYTSEMSDLNRLLMEANKIEVEDKPRDLAPLKKLLNTDFESLYNSLDKEEQRQLWRSIIDTMEVSGNDIIKVNFKA